MYKKIRRTENAIARLTIMLEILTMNTEVLVNLRRLDAWPRRNMLQPISKMVDELKEMVQKTNCLEILREWGDVECLGHWENDPNVFDAGNGEVFGCKICSGAVGYAEMQHKVFNRQIKDIRNYMKAYSEFTDVPMKELTARQLQ